jgi:hypothetical protein
MFKQPSRNFGTARHARIPWWYPDVGVPFNVVWRSQIDRFVYGYWLPGLRAYQGKKLSRFTAHNGEVLFAVCAHVQISVQESVHVTGKASRGMAVRSWVNLSLDDKDKKAIIDAEIDPETMFQDLGALVFRGYRFSLTFDDYSSSLQASLVCAQPDDPNYEHGVSTRHPDPLIALKSLFYKLHKMGDEPWENWCTTKTPDQWS